MDVEQATSPKYLAVLAVAACLILGLGWLLRPREIQNAPAPLPSENELAQLARRTERRSLDGMTQYFAGTADDVDASLVHLPEVGASGVAWDDGTIVTVPLARHDAGTLRVEWPFGEARQELTMWGPDLPLAALTSTGMSGLTTVRAAASLPGAGGWVLAVWRAGPDRRFAAGSYLQSTAITCGPAPVREVVSSLALHHTMSGGGLFDADGALLAVILPCGDRFAAVAAESVDAILKESATDSRRVLARFGIDFAALADEQRARFKLARGAFVRTVWTGHRGDEAGLRPGDVVVDLNDMPVETEKDLTALLAHVGEQAIILTVRRRSQTVRVVLAGTDTARESPPDRTAPGVVWASSASGYRVGAVRPGSRAASAGLKPGDRVLRIDHLEPRNLSRVQRTLANESGPGVLLEIARDDRRLALLW